MVTINSEFPFIVALRYSNRGAKTQADYIGEIARYNSTIFREGDTEGFTRHNDADTNAKRFVQNALGRTLGRRLNTSDPKAMLASIDRAFTSTKNDAGSPIFEWTPRSYAVQTELGGKVTGAQASLYRRAKAALDEILPLLDRLEPIENAPDEEEVEAYRAIVRQEITSLVGELGIEGGWRESRVNMLFGNLLGKFDPTNIDGHLADLGRVFGFTQGNSITTIVEEEIFTDFLVIYDHIQSLRVSWQNILEPLESRFLGTKVVLLERALHSLAEGVDELQYVMESVGLGPAERRVVRLYYEEIASPTSFTDVNMTIAELLDWIVEFATEDAPNLIENAGSIGIETLLPTLSRLYQTVLQVVDANNTHSALQTVRVENALSELASHIAQVYQLISNDNQLADIQQTLATRRPAIKQVADTANGYHKNPTIRNQEKLIRAIERLFNSAKFDYDYNGGSYNRYPYEGGTQDRYKGQYTQYDQNDDYGSARFTQDDLYPTDEEVIVKQEIVELEIPDDDYDSVEFIQTDDDITEQYIETDEEEVLIVEQEIVAVETLYDDFSVIYGIGEKTDQILTDAGIASFAQLAQSDVTVVQNILKERGISQSQTSIADWISEARNRSGDEPQS